MGDLLGKLLLLGLLAVFLALLGCFGQNTEVTYLSPNCPSGTLVCGEGCVFYANVCCDQDSGSQCINSSGTCSRNPNNTNNCVRCPAGTAFCGNKCIAIGSTCCNNGRCGSVGRTPVTNNPGSNNPGSNNPLGNLIGGNNPPIDPNTGCPPMGSCQLECTQWIQFPRCSVQSCSCYYSDSTGDTGAAYYRTSDNQYFRCSGKGVLISCTSAAERLAQYCGPRPPP